MRAMRGGERKVMRESEGLQRCPALRTAETLLNAMDIKGGVSASGRSGADDCVCRLRSGGGGDLAFATVVRLRRRDLSSRNSALSAFSSFFSFLIFLSFFDIARPPPWCSARMVAQSPPARAETFAQAISAFA